ncbi:hypothetical protein BGX38DRAFT_1274463 [Terfezia claveryi]|nr:hypothetical protein BGX38DRAFT_1274463 [Terfezia claveryi]
MTRERLGYRLGHRLTKAQADLKASSAILEHLYMQNNRKGTNFTEEYFDIQLELQEVYYWENRNKAEPVDPNDVIFTAILNEEEILRDLEEDRRAGIPTRRKLPPPNQKLDRRDLKQVSKGHAAVHRTTQLLTQQHQTIDDWVDRQAPDSKYKIYENRKIMQKLHNIQQGLIQNTTTRKKELEAIRSRVGHKNSKKFMTCLNQRWKAVNIGIAEFNELIEKLAIEQCSKELDIRKIKKKGLTLDTFWDVNCVRITDDWNIMTGFLKAQARYGLEISKTQQTMIMELQNRIHTMLTSIWSAGIEVKKCIEEEDFGDDNKVIGELLA